jgi:hypothetical protein
MPTKPAAIDADREAAVDLMLVLAEGNARRGDYGFAMREVDAADALAGGLSPEYRVKRRHWDERRRVRTPTARH